MITVDIIKIPRTGNRFKISGIDPSYLTDIYTIKGFMTSPEPLVIKQLIEKFGKNNVRLHPTIKDQYQKYNQMIQLLHHSDVDLSAFNWGDVQLTPKQVSGVWFLKNAGKSCILADDMGLGKSLTCLALTQVEQYKKVLIVAPAAVKNNWITEYNKWGVGGGIVVCEDEKKSREIALNTAIENGTRYIVINYEMLNIEKYPQLFSVKWDCVLFDEAHYLKSRVRRDKQTKGIKSGLRHYYAKKLKSEKTIFVTGTPFCNNAAEIWSILNLIDSKRFKSYWEFANYFCNVKRTFYGDKETGLNKAHEKDLKYLLSRYMIRRDKEIDSKKVFYTHGLKFSGEQKTVYKKAKNHYIYGDSIIESDIERFIRTLQISADPGILDVTAPSIINDKCIELCNEQHNSLTIIGCVYKEHVASLYKKLNSIYLRQGIPVYEITGDTTDRHDVVERFKRSQCGILITTITAIAEGLSIDECDHMILADLTFSPTKNWQFYNRIHRLTSTRDKHYHLLVTEGVNELKHEALTLKQEMIDSLMKCEHHEAKTVIPNDIRDYVMQRVKQAI